MLGIHQNTIITFRIYLSLVELFQDMFQEDVVFDIFGYTSQPTNFS